MNFKYISLFLCFTLLLCAEVEYAYQLKFTRQVEEYINKNNLTSKAAITKKEFTDMFLDIITDGKSYTAGEDFKKLADSIFNKSGKEEIPVTSLPSMFNLTEMTLLYSSLNEQKETKETNNESSDL